MEEDNQRENSTGGKINEEYRIKFFLFFNEHRARTCLVEDSFVSDKLRDDNQIPRDRSELIKIIFQRYRGGIPSFTGSPLKGAEICSRYLRSGFKLIKTSLHFSAHLTS